MIHYLTIICLIIIQVEVLSQGNARGDESECTTVGCAIQGHMVLIVVGITIGILVFIGCFTMIIICGIEFCRKKSAPKKEFQRSRNEYIKRNKQIENDLSMPINFNSIFESGQWSSRYYQNDRFHGPFLHEIFFNIHQNTLRGNGIDDIGQFSLTGQTSTEFLTIHMTKDYRSNLNNRKEKFGHQAEIHLQWNNEKRLFEGRWFVHSYTQKSEGLYELVKVQQSFVNMEEYSNYT